MKAFSSFAISLSWAALSAKNVHVVVSQTSDNDFSDDDEDCRTTTRTQYVTCGGITCSDSYTGGCDSDERFESSTQRDCSISASTSICWYDYVCCKSSTSFSSSSTTTMTTTTTSTTPTRPSWSRGGTPSPTTLPVSTNSSPNAISGGEPNNVTTRGTNEQPLTRTEQICEVEMSRKTGDSKRTVRERLEPAHTCTCGETTEGDEDTFQIECVTDSSCKICSLGPCIVDSNYTRTFFAEESSSSSDGSVTFATHRVQQNRCATSKGLFGLSNDIVACIYSGRERIAMTINGKECAVTDKYCNEGNDNDGDTNPVFNCTALGDQIYDFCLDNAEGLVPDPETAAFAFLHEDFDSSRCSSAVRMHCVGGIIGLMASFIVVFVIAFA